MGMLWDEGYHVPEAVALLRAALQLTVVNDCQIPEVVALRELAADATTIDRVAVQAAAAALRWDTSGTPDVNYQTANALRVLLDGDLDEASAVLTNAIKSMHASDVMVVLVRDGVAPDRAHAIRDLMEA